MSSSKCVKVKVPGTTANCGPGFDVMGIACSIYNELELTLLEEKKLTIEIYGDGAENIPKDNRNMVWRCIEELVKKSGAKYKGAHIKMTNNVPLSRGLGSSATAIVAGLVAVIMIGLIIPYMILSLDKKKAGPIIGMIAGVVSILNFNVVNLIAGIIFIIYCERILASINKNGKDKKQAVSKNK